MKNLGEYLRAERLARGINLEQISADTRISISMLQAIEEGNTAQLPAPVFTKGFLRAYAEQIGLDPDAVIAEYQDRVEEVDAPQETIVSFHERLRPKSPRRKHLGLLLGLPLLVVLALFFWRTKHVRQESPSAISEKPAKSTQAKQTTSRSDLPAAPNQDQSATQSQQTPDLSRSGIEPAPANSELDTQTATVPPTAEKVFSTQESNLSSEDESQQQIRAEPPASAPYVLEARTTQTTWLRITIDEMQEREYLLQPGEQVTWRATRGYKLHIGNAAGLQLYLNDKPIEALGESGRVVRLVLPDPSLFNRSDANTPTQ
jgi:cytoskeleton protein RodZ